MKTLKSLLMLCAGLSFCACSSDNEPQFPEGKGMLEVKIVNPTSTRAVGESAEGTIVNGDVGMWLYHDLNPEGEYVYFTYDEDEDTYAFSQGDNTVDADYVGTTNYGEWTSFRFYNIGTPTELTVSFNEGLIEGATGNIEDMQNPARVPVFGSVSEGFTLTDDVVEKGGTPYQQWECWVNHLTPSLARLEVQLTAGTFDDNFDYVAIAGAYLDKICPDDETEVVDYYLQYDNSTSKSADGTGEDAYAILCDNYMTAEGTLGSGALVLYGDAENGQTVINEGGKIPSENNYYGYNIYPSTPPEFKLCLKVKKGTIEYMQYAIINSYKDATTSEVIDYFEQGYIYKVTNLTLSEDNIQVNEEVGTLDFGLTATVVKAEWNVLETIGEWAQ